jgi:hypothetical protein
MADIIQQELAVRAAVLDVADTGTFLVKSDSPGRLYEPKTIAEVQDILGIGEYADDDVRCSFSWGSVSSIIINRMIPDQLVRSIDIVIFEEFNGVGAMVTVGTDVDHDLLVATTQVDLRTVGTYTIYPGHKFLVATDIKMFHTPGAGASSGNGTIIINL